MINASSSGKDILAIYLKLGGVDLLATDYEFMSIYFLLICQIVALVVIDHFLCNHFE